MEYCINLICLTKHLFEGQFVILYLLSKPSLFMVTEYASN